jgi:hypothetical protein
VAQQRPLVEGRMSATHAALGSAILAGVVVAVAPDLPDVLRSPLIVAALAAWAGGVGWPVVAAARRHDHSPLTAFHLMGLVGIGLAVLATTALEIIRLFARRAALVWNVDWQYALGQAQAIARTGGLHASLDYAGAPIRYHVGPAWFAGAAERTLGLNLGVVLFGLVPLLCTLTFAIAAVSLLRGRGVSAGAAVGATGIAMALPGIAFTLPTTGYCLILSSCRDNPELWTFSPDIMLNTFQGVAVGMAALALLLDPAPRLMRTVLGCLGIAVLVAIKPQAVVGYGLIAGLVGLGYVLAIPGFRPRTGRILVAAIAGAVLAAGLLTAFPHVDAHFGEPVWAPGRTPFPFMEDRLVPTALLLLALFAARRYLNRHVPVRTLLLTAVAGVLGLGAILAVVAIRVRPDIASRMAQLGADPTQRTDLLSALQPLRLLVALLSIAALLESIVRLRGRSRQLAYGVAWVTAASPLLFIVPSLLAPAKAFQAEEDAGLMTVLTRLPDNGGVLISSDLADEAENYRRPLREFNLTAYTGRPFYVANLQYGNHAEPDAVKRMTELRAFFGAPWSAWSTRWLARAGIAGVLVNTRCRPAWLGQPHLPLREVARSGRWVAFVVVPGVERDTLADATPPPWHDMTPAYGLSGCLTGLRSATEPAQ